MSSVSLRPCASGRAPLSSPNPPGEISMAPAGSCCAGAHWDHLSVLLMHPIMSFALRGWTRSGTWSASPVSSTVRYRLPIDPGATGAPASHPLRQARISPVRMVHPEPPCPSCPDIFRLDQRVVFVRIKRYECIHGAAPFFWRRSPSGQPDGPSV